MNLRNVLYLFTATLLFSTLIGSTEVSVDSIDSAHQGSAGIVLSRHLVPPNDAAIIRLLIKKGLLKESAAPEEVERALKAYYRQKLVAGQPDKGVRKALLLEALQGLGQAEAAAGGVEIDRDQLLSKLLEDDEEELEELEDEAEDEDEAEEADDDEFEDIPGVQEKTWTGSVKKAKLLILLAEFTDDEYGVGPLHNAIQEPGPEDNISLWVSDFSPQHYQQMLFTKGGYDAVDQNGETLHLDSMVDYYLEISNGSLEVEGQAFGWFQLPQSEAYYGDDDPEAGIDNRDPGNPHDLVRDLLKEAEAQDVPFEEFDLEDPFDLDGDGDLEEPDGIIDHLVIVHAGVDQSGGGGVQGDDAIWAHSSSVLVHIPSDNPTVPYWDGDMVAYNYIIQGEDGAIGVFCHEFGHDLGLPDEYDTKYSGQGEPVGFYSLMSSGSWTGKPLGTKPAPISPWGRMMLGRLHGGQWVQPVEIDYQELSQGGKSYLLDQATSWGQNQQAVRVNLPQHKKLLTMPYEGQFEWYSGKGDLIDHTIKSSLALPAGANITLSYWTAYKIEKDWDFGFVQISTDGGASWTSLATGRTSDSIVGGGHEAIKANMPGYTGDSGGWVQEVVDLSGYAGQEIMLQYRYMTDWATAEEGFYLDQIEVSADGAVIFQDDAESGSGQWLVDGWQLFQGFVWKDHYYLLEWRTHNKTDVSQKYGYSFKGGSEVQFFENQPGLILWYRDTAFDDNWVGIHPGQVFLGIVDAHPFPIFDADGQSIRTRLQIHDASFGLYEVPPKLFYANRWPLITNWAEEEEEFGDYRKYWYAEAPSSGIKVPGYDLEFEVQGASDDYTVGAVTVRRRDLD